MYCTCGQVARMFRTGKNPSGRSYYDFSPAVGWRVVLVDTYEISQMHAAGSPAYQEARRVLEANNPNDTLHGCVACVPSCDATPFPRLQPHSRRGEDFAGHIQAGGVAWASGCLQV